MCETDHCLTTPNRFTSCLRFVEINFRYKLRLIVIVSHSKNIKDLACNDIVKVKSYPSGPYIVLTSTVWHSDKINRPTSHGAFCRQSTAYFTPNISVPISVYQQTTLQQTYQCQYQHLSRPRYNKHISANISISADHATPNISVLTLRETHCSVLMHYIHKHN